MSRNRYRYPASRSHFKLWGEILSYIGVLFGLFLVFGVLYMEFFAPESLLDTEQTDMQPVSGSLYRSEIDFTSPPPAFIGPLPDEEIAEEEEPGVYRGTVTQGLTASVLLQQWLSGAESRDVLEASSNVYSLTKLRIGHPYTAYVEDGKLVHFEYEVDRDHLLMISRQASADADGEAAKVRWVATLEPIQYEVQLARVEGTINGSLFESVSKAGEKATLAQSLANIFAWEINFIRDIRPGDSFRVLIEKRYRNGEFKSYGRIVAAEFVNQGSKYEAYLFKDSFDKDVYFNAAGDSLKRAFLKAPLSFTRISSRFSLRRMHPILRTVRPHPGIDYAAPMGTPVKAVGNGVVTYRGWGRGAGNYITLNHPNGYETMYLHLSGFAKNLKKGGRVRQGEVIGYVGSTGYSTGPHLDFRMKKGGQFVNPEKILAPRDESVAKKKINVFKENRDSLRKYLLGEKDPKDYASPDV